MKLVRLHATYPRDHAPGETIEARAVAVSCVTRNRHAGTNTWLVIADPERSLEIGALLQRAAIPYRELLPLHVGDVIYIKGLGKTIHQGTVTAVLGDRSFTDDELAVETTPIRVQFGGETFETWGWGVCRLADIDWPSWEQAGWQRVAPDAMLVREHFATIAELASQKAMS